MKNRPLTKTNLQIIGSRIRAFMFRRERFEMDQLISLERKKLEHLQTKRMVLQ